jgi:hypothetical protein
MFVLSGTAEATLVFDEIDEHIVAQSFRGGEECATLIDLGEALNELP